MTYRLQIAFDPPSMPAAPALSPAIVICDFFDTAEDAETVARWELENMGRPKGTVWYRILDPEGREDRIVE